MYIVGLIPKNPDCLTTVILITGYRKSHVERIINDYFSDYEQTQDRFGAKYFQRIDLNSRGKPTKPIVTVKDGVAEFDSGKVTVIDYDNLEGI